MEIAITVDSTVTDIAEGLTTGHAQVHSIRTNGTSRRRHFLTCTDLEQALWVRAQREGQEADEAEGVEAIVPQSMKAIATYMHLSVSAVRRILIDLAITEEILDMEQDDLESLLVGYEDLVEDTTENE